MSGYEEDGSRSTGGFAGKLQDILLFPKYHFSGHYNLLLPVNSENTIILSKNIVRHIKTQSTQIFDKKHRCCSGIALTKYVDLPQSGYKYRKMMYDLIHRKVSVRELLLLRKVIIQRCPQLRGATVEHGCSIQHPFPLCDVVITDMSCMRIDAGKQLPVNGNILIGCKTKCALGQ